MSMNEEILAETRKLKGKSLSYKLGYFWEYYKYAALGVIIGIIAIVSIVKAFVTNKPVQFEVAFVNTSTYVPDSSEFAERVGINTDKYSVYYDTSYQISVNEVYNDSTINSSQKLIACLAAHELDVMVGDKLTVMSYAKADMFMDLRLVFTEDELADLKDRLVYATTIIDEEKGTESDPFPAGLLIGDSPKLKSAQTFGDSPETIKEEYTPVFTTIINSENPQWCKEFYYYLMEQ